MTRLCLTLAEASPADLEEKIARYSGQASLIEVRLDYLDPPGLPRLPAGGETRFIATCRPGRQGGRYQGEERARLRLLEEAVRNGFSWVDLEVDVQGFPTLPPGVRIIRSDHLLEGFKLNPDEHLRRLEEAGGDVFKLAVAIRGTAQLVHLLGWMESVLKPSRLIIGMGDLGQPSRLLGGFLGNPWTYLAEHDDRGVAPGQFSLERAMNCYRLHHWSHPPSIYGVLGNPVSHSLSPSLHSELFRRHDLESVYLPFLLDDLEAWMGYVTASRLPFRGFSVTLPFKTRAARWIGPKSGDHLSLNTLTRGSGGWEGSNTDHAGFLNPLEPHLQAGFGTALVLGNGGVAHTVVRALQERGLSVTVAGRDAARVNDFTSAHGCSGILFEALPREADLCVNTTPVGQFPDPEACPLEEEDLRFRLVYDLIYHPEETRLLELARRRGIPTLSGIDMFVEQAALQFASWTSFSPDRSFMKDIVRHNLRSPVPQ